MRIDDVVDRLGVLGLSLEAAVYIHLSVAGPTKASDIAAALKLHRVAYRMLQSLVQRGFASATLRKLTRFEAAPPENLFDLLAAQQARAEHLEQARVEIVPALLTLRGQPGRNLSKNTFKVLQGRREIYGVLERMVREAREGVKALSTHPGGPSLGGGCPSQGGRG